VAGAGAGPLVWLTGGTGSTGSGKTTLGAQLQSTGAFACCTLCLGTTNG